MPKMKEKGRVILGLMTVQEKVSFFELSIQ